MFAGFVACKCFALNTALSPIPSALCLFESGQFAQPFSTGAHWISLCRCPRHFFMLRVVLKDVC